MQEQQTPRRDPQGSTLLLRWLSQGTETFGGRRFKTVRGVILQVSLGALNPSTWSKNLKK